MTEHKPQYAMQELVNLQSGCISREIFVNEAIYQQEQEQLFARAWLFIGHESQIPKPGDYFATSMGEESVILARDSKGIIHAFLNTCTHRGMKVCRYDEGNTPSLPAPTTVGVWHGWPPRGVPYYREAS
jgi:nitrite reductase/ring-hydroxylating ferredoxin subunit